MKLFLAAALMFATGVAFGQGITTCRAPEGKAFYHYAGAVPKDKAGWTNDKISKGIFSLTKVGKDAFDILFVDSFEKPISSTQDGGLVRLLRRSADSITVMVLYPSTIEIYSFFREKDGRNRFSLLQNRTGDGPFFPKSSLLVGDCDEIAFNK